MVDGVAVGETVHLVAVVCGPAAVVSASPVLFAAIRWAGAAYLIVLGIRALADRGTPDGCADRGHARQARSQPSPRCRVNHSPGTTGSGRIGS
ncbi:LysE family transporter [Micromonospora rifamycinica]|uniref:LysE family translocator n=1 Tax=Micromonospora rifamycinica TaxID=291594 RepID=UPI00340128F8